MPDCASQQARAILQSSRLLPCHSRRKGERNASKKTWPRARSALSRSSRTTVPHNKPGYSLILQRQLEIGFACRASDVTLLPYLATRQLKEGERPCGPTRVGAEQKGSINGFFDDARVGVAGATGARFGDGG